jgi:1-phosphofructokinase family hexose kinase
MIVAAGLTPAWQQILVFDRLDLGEVNRAREAHWCASGKVLNVGVALGHLGADSQTVALAGGPPREAIERELTSLGIRHFLVTSHWSTRVCTTLLDRATGRTTELVENAGPVTAEELQEFTSVFSRVCIDADVVVLTGSLPAGAPETFYRDLLGRVSCRTMLDVRGPELLAALPWRPFLVKPNREELAQTVGRPLSGDSELLAAMREINDQGAAWVVVSDGRKILRAYGEGRAYRLQPLALETVNPIGCGDCLAAGIAWGLSLGRAPLDALRLGIAAAAENAGELLPARLDPQRVQEMAEQVRIEEAF